MHARFLLSLPLLLAGAGLSAEEGERIIITDADKAGPDFAIQGEYRGLTEPGSGGVGVQVIAMGNGRFRAVFEPGGLPGDGWTGKDQVTVEATLVDGKLAFRGNGYQVRSGSGMLVGTAPGNLTLTASHLQRQSPTLLAKPPAGAVVLFDGKNADAWNGPGMDGRGFLKCGSTSKRSFVNFTLHLEFMECFRPLDSGQERGNSGVYLQNRYEVQVLDSFGLPPSKGDCGGIWSTAPATMNLSFPPLSWQTYDIVFTAAVFDTMGKKQHAAVATIKHNGMLIHDHQEIPNPTGGQDGSESAKPGPIYLQEHGSPVVFRNIWLVEE